MNSITTVITQQPAPVLPPVQLKVSNKHKVKVFLEKIQKECDKLPLQHSQSVSQWFTLWGETFLKKYDPDSALEEERVDAASGISHLIHYGLMHVTYNIAQQETEEQIAWFDLSEEAKAILDEIVPVGTGEKFFNEYESYEAQKKYLSTVSSLEEVFEQNGEDLYGGANEVNQELIHLDDQVRQQLLQTAETYELKQLYKCVDSATHEIEKLFQETKQDVQGAEKIGQKLEQTEMILRNNLNNAEQIVERF